MLIYSLVVDRYLKSPFLPTLGRLTCSFMCTNLPVRRPRTESLSFLSGCRILSLALDCIIIAYSNNFL